MNYVRRMRERIMLGAIRKHRRETIYKMMRKKHCGKVPCFVRSKHVIPSEATLEHILPVSKGGTDDMENLSISHRVCNERRGNNYSGSSSSSG